MNWLERARREIYESADLPTANTVERNPTAVLAVPHSSGESEPRASIGSIDSTPTPRLLASEAAQEASANDSDPQTSVGNGKMYDRLIDLNRGATAPEADELRCLVRAFGTLYGFSEAEYAEALAVALSDPVAALDHFRTAARKHSLNTGREEVKAC